MKLSDQVCTLSHAKRLKELGVRQESLFYWIDYSKNPHGPKIVIADAMPIDIKSAGNVFSAFTVAELGVILPNYCETWRDEDKIWCAKDSSSIHPFKGETEAQAKAALLIFLIEAQLTNIE